MVLCHGEGVIKHGLLLQPEQEGKHCHQEKVDRIPEQILHHQTRTSDHQTPGTGRATRLASNTASWEVCMSMGGGGVMENERAAGGSCSEEQLLHHHSATSSLGGAARRSFRPQVSSSLSLQNHQTQLDANRANASIRTPWPGLLLYFCLTVQINHKHIF